VGANELTPQWALHPVNFVQQRNEPFCISTTISIFNMWIAECAIKLTDGTFASFSLLFVALALHSINLVTCNFIHLYYQVALCNTGHGV